MTAITRLLMVVSLIGSGLACQSAAPTRTPDAQVVHVVVCWLNTPGDDHARARLIRESEAFEGEIPGLLDVSAGRALPSGRPTVDSSYDVAIVMRFRNERALREYEEHPLHRDAVQRVLKPSVSRVLIYDFVDETGSLPRRSR